MFHYTVKTTKPVEEAVDALEKSLRNHQFGVLWQVNVPGVRLNGLGIDYAYRILEVCHPGIAGGVLEIGSSFIFPCTVRVYRTCSFGKTKIGFPRITKWMDVVGDDRLRELAEDVETALKRAIDEAV